MIDISHLGELTFNKFCISFSFETSDVQLFDHLLKGCKMQYSEGECVSELALSNIRVCQPSFLYAIDLVT